VAAGDETAAQLLLGAGALESTMRFMTCKALPSFVGRDWQKHQLVLI
jgi:hypothetical protein